MAEDQKQVNVDEKIEQAQAIRKMYPTFSHMGEVEKFIAQRAEQTFVKILNNDNPRIKNEVLVFNGSGMVKHQDPEHAVTNRTMKSTEAFVDYCKRWLDPEIASVYYDDKGFIARVSELWEEGKICFDFTSSDEIGDWIKRFDQSDFIEHLQMNAQHVLCFGAMEAGEFTQNDNSVSDVMLSLHNLQMKDIVEYNSEINPNNSDISFSFTSKEGKTDSKSLPLWWKIDIPLFEGTPEKEIIVKLNIKRPSRESGQPLFEFTCPFIARYRKEVVEEEAEEMVESLGEKWSISFGSDKNGRSYSNQSD